MITAKTCFKKGQSLIELAIFSTVIFLAMGVLVSYALSYNHNQHLTMLANKRARHLATQAHNTYLYASVAVVFDKPVASVSNMFGIPKRVPVVASSSAVHSNDLYSEMDGVDEELPRVVYDINGKTYALKTAAFVTKSFTEDDAKRKAWIDDWNGEGLAWQWEYPAGEDDNSEDSEGLVEAVKSKDEDAAERQFDDGTAWDIDGDGEEEVIVDKDRGLVMDSQDGELDMTEPSAALQNGLLPDTSSSEYNQSQLRNTQQESRFQTKTIIRHQEVIQRPIRLNPKFTDFSDIKSQLAAQNPGCNYDEERSCDDPSLGADCDCLYESEGQKFLWVRGLFSTDKEAYVWSRDE